MGHDLTLNYIVKVPDKRNWKEFKPGDQFSVEKSGIRHYMMNCPLYLADNEWNLIGKCSVISQILDGNRTIFVCELLFLFTDKESEVITRLNRIGEKELSKCSERVNDECPLSKKVVKMLLDYEAIPDEEDELLFTADALKLRDDKVTIAYISNGRIMLQGFFVGLLYNSGHIHSEHNNIWIDADGEIRSNIRCLNFKTKNGFKGIAFSKFDLID